MKQRQKACIVFVLGALNELERNGLVETSGLTETFSVKGWSVFDQLEAEGVRPSEEEAYRAIVALYNRKGMENPPPEFCRDAATLIANWDRVKHFLGMKKKAEEN